MNTRETDADALAQCLRTSDLAGAEALLAGLNPDAVSSPDLAELASSLFARLCEPEKAAQLSARASELDRDNPARALRHSSDLVKAGQLDEAEAILDRLRTVPGLQAELAFRRGRIQYQRKDFPAAEEILLRLLAAVPGFGAAHMELAHVLLMQGHWRDGWREYEWRFRLPGTRAMLPRFRMPHWNGSDGTNHLLLIADQGYGDCFQFIRYLPRVAQCCRKVTLMRSGPIARLMDRLPGVSASFDRWEHTPMADGWCTLSALPGLFGTEPGNIPATASLFSVDSNHVAAWRERMGKGDGSARLRVGITWTGRVDFELNPLRAMPFYRMAPLLDAAGVEFYSLQVGPTSCQARGNDIIDLSADLTDFYDTAAAMQALDLVITTDTATAHLAGALGRPTWVLLNHAPDWRWGPDGNDSAWYPSTRLFRQDQSRNWDGVIRECKAALEELVNGKKSASPQGRRG